MDAFASKAAEWDNPNKRKMTDKFVEELLKNVTPNSSWKAIEIGAGTGLVGLEILPLVGEMIFEDTSESMLNVLKSKLPEHKSDQILHAEITEYTRKDIDFVFSCMAFHHIADIENTLLHLAKITKPGAIIAIGDLREEDGSFHSFAPIPHCGFNTDVLSKQFENAGFKVIKEYTYHSLIREAENGSKIEFDQFILIAKKEV